MKWNILAFVSVSIGILTTLISVLNFNAVKRDAEIRVKILNIRENTSQALANVSKNPVLSSSLLRSAKGISEDLKFERITDILDTLSNTVGFKGKESQIDRLFSELKRETDLQLLKHETSFNLLLPLISMMLFFAGIVFIALSTIELKKNITVLERVLEDIRLGLLDGQFELSGDFEKLQSILVAMTSDLKRLRINVQKITKS